MQAYPRVVWVAGGLLKGASVDDLVARVADRLVGAVLIGRDSARGCRCVITTRARCTRREVVTGEDAGVHGTNESAVTHVTYASVGRSGRRAVMAAAVEAARDLAAPGDTVLLAPAGASFDQFSGYADRGDRFAAAVHALSVASE